MTTMFVLTAPVYPYETLRYAALTTPREALAALRRDVAAGRLDEANAAHIASTLPLLALEESARRTGYLRLQDALVADETWDAISATTGRDPDRVAQLRRQFPEVWMRSVWHGTGRHELAVTAGAAPRLCNIALHGYTTDQVRLPVGHRAVHIIVPPSAALEVPDGLGRTWLAAHILLVEEPAPRRRWRLCVEAGALTDAPARHVMSVDLPAGVDLDTVVRGFDATVVAGARWRAIWTWTLAAVLMHTPPSSLR
ncbi:hypothetical protein OWM54_42915 [Myxococcus sp. MISCRS1]|uniref:hypothetical protein n=1 Tax=Myxococcus sp. MISCRS1 TaxID=2996786 RepID=UPI00226DBFC6|nr:hypothetical protein [Myxococcus sp. MISCRS1]MCY1003917.1 hypothetical protein [Myxococcus sp. MISCRS1]